MCEAQAVACEEPTLRAEWLVMAAEWRRLGGDENAQATMARLMHPPIIG